MRRGHIGDAGASGKPNADLPRCNADDKGENDRGLITSDTKTRLLNQAPAVRSTLLHFLRDDGSETRIKPGFWGCVARKCSAAPLIDRP
jgi:hypothetical protein